MRSEVIGVLTFVCCFWKNRACHVAGHARTELTVGVFLRSVKSSKKMVKAAVVPRKRRSVNEKREEMCGKAKGSKEKHPMHQVGDLKRVH